jgi:stage III sporulation protein AE
MRRLLILLALLPALLLFAPRAGAADVETAQREALRTDRLEDAVPESAGEEVGRLTLDDALDLDRCVEALGATLKNALSGAVKSGLSSVTVIVSSVMLSSALGIFLPRSPRAPALVCIAAIAAVALRDSASLTALGRGAMEDIGAFSKMLLPTLTAAAAAGGAVTSASAKYAASVFFIDLLLTGAGRLVLPLIYAYMAASVASAAFGGEGLGGACALLKWAAVTVMTVTVLAFTVYLSLTGIISGSVDASAAARRGQRFHGPAGGGRHDRGRRLLRAGGGGHAAWDDRRIRPGAVPRRGFRPSCGSRPLSSVQGRGGSLGAVAEPEVGRLLSSLSTAFGMCWDWWGHRCDAFLP